MIIRLFLALIVVLGISSCEKKSPIEYPDCLNQFGTFEPNNKPGDGVVELVFYDNSDLAVNEDDDRVYVEKIAGDILLFK